MGIIPQDDDGEGRAEWESLASRGMIPMEWIDNPLRMFEREDFYPKPHPITAHDAVNYALKKHVIVEAENLVQSAASKLLSRSPGSIEITWTSRRPYLLYADLSYEKTWTWRHFTEVINDIQRGSFDGARARADEWKWKAPLSIDFPSEEIIRLIRSGVLVVWWQRDAVSMHLL